MDSWYGGGSSAIEVDVVDGVVILKNKFEERLENATVAGELQLLLRGVTGERYIKCCGLVVGQITVGGSGCYLAIDVGFGIL
uniref:Uncharacterized protein n=1 Tax=Romanomermis culicivorax TaxID=13658 RepID=A0A915J1T7_ROMCU